MAYRILAYSVLALSGCSIINAHVILSQPAPYFATQLAGDKSPLPDGSSYPCKWPIWSQESDLDSLPKRTTLQVGAQNTVKFDGTAVHNGGSCQLSITTDTTLHRNSTFKVFLSIEGGCPGIGSTVADFPYTLPASIPSGNATFAWTWFPVSSGGKEMYMNCAPVTITGGANNDAEFSKLPNLFIANLANDNEFTCQTQDNRVVEFPDPGELFLNKAELKSGDILGALAAPTNKNTGGVCKKDGATTLVSQGQATGAASTVALASSATSAVLAGFTEVSVASSSAAAATPEPVPTTPVTPADAPPVATAAADSLSSGSSKGTCSSGDVVCNGTSQFGICNEGKVVWQEVAAGTICEYGAIKALSKARAAAEVRDKRSHLHSHRRRPFHD